MEIFKLDGKKGSVIVRDCDEETCKDLERKKKNNNKCEHGINKYYCKQCGGKGLCIHDKRKSRCKVCGGSELCEHGRQKVMCKDCGGSGICEHNRQKSLCKDCGGKGICEHDRIRTYCKECKGTGICEHDKIRSYCKVCVGTSICEHGKIKTYCKDCDGSGYCDHGKQKQFCKECGGSQICEHGIKRYDCKKCKGGGVCEHDRMRRSCKECKGIGVCEHDRQKSSCKECGGSQVCGHGRQKSLCVECEGSQICIHKRVKYYCKICDGSRLCKSSWCESLGKYEGYCMSCCIRVYPEMEVSRNYKTKEKGVAEKVLEAFPDFTWVSDKRIQDGCSRRRPDLLLDMGSHIIIVEVDENQHNDYDCSCENKRLMEISQDVGHRPIVFIRFNPDEYTNEKGKKIKSCWKYNKNGVMRVDPDREKDWEKRIKCLLDQIKYWTEHPTEKTVEIVQLFYSMN
jgi:hypothetical protein